MLSRQARRSLTLGALPVSAGSQVARAQDTLDAPPPPLGQLVDIGGRTSTTHCCLTCALNCRGAAAA